VRVQKPWRSAGLYLPDCVCWLVLLIPVSGAGLQPVSASQKRGSGTGLPLLRPVLRAKCIENKVGARHLLLSRTKGRDVIFSVTLVLIKSKNKGFVYIYIYIYIYIKVKHSAKCVTQ